MLILIADDDRLIRFTMKSMLTDILADEEYSFLEAANGREMLEICRKRNPDIVFADIKMPYMSGLDAIEEAIRTTEDIEFVVISGYSDFQYAKRGIALGIYEYMVKPIDPDELSSIMADLREKIRRHKKADNSDFRMKVMEGYSRYSAFGHIPEDDMTVVPDGLSGYGRAVMSFSYGKEGERRLLESVERLETPLTRNGGRFCVIYSAIGIPVILEMHPSGRDYLTAGDFGRAVRSSDTGAVMLSFPFRTLGEAFDRISTLDDAPHLLLLSRGPLFPLLEGLGTPEGRKAASVLYSYMEALRDSDEITACGKADELGTLDMPPAREFSALRRNVSSFLLMEAGGDDMAGLSSYLSSATREWIKRNGCRDNTDLPARMTAYIDRNYMNDIGIADLADHFGLTPNYVSTLFHQSTGTRFTDYLTDTRMAHARHLLVSNANASIKDIAIMAGYNSPRHFASIFQKIVGMTPSAYRKSRIGSDS